MSTQIAIQFTSVPNVNDSIRLFNPNYLGMDGVETFKTQRTATKEVTIDADLEVLASNFVNSVIADYGASGNITLGRIGAIVSIDSDDDDVFDGWSINGDFANVQVNDVTNTSPLTIENVEYFEADNDPCNNVKVRVTANKPFSNITLPVQATQTAATSIEFDLSRSVYFEIRISEGSEFASSVARNNLTPSILDPNNATITETATPQGVNIGIDYPPSFGLVDRNGVSSLTYSLDNVTYQSSNVFAGLLAGTYTIYLKDSYGCAKSLVYTVGNFTPGQTTAEPFFYVAPSNPIFFVETRKTPECENENVDNVISKKVAHYVKDCDFRTIQFRSSYTDHEVLLKDCNGVVIDTITPIIKTDNINRYDSRDGWRYSDDLGRIRIYFTSGKTYDVNGNDLDANHFLNGDYPNFYKVGIFVNVGGTFASIIGQEYNDELDRWEFITSLTTITPVEDTTTILSVYYNTQGYNIYEAEYNFNGLEGIYQAVINVAGREFLSEFIEVSSELPEHHLMVYGSDKNNDIIYSTGFYGTVRIPFDLTPTLIPSDELDNYQADDRLIQLENRFYEQYEFTFFEVVHNVALQLNHILKNSSVFVDGLEYTKVGSVETSRVRKSKDIREATYSVKVTMQRQRVNSYVNDSYNPNDLINAGAFTFDNLLTSGSSFIDSNGLVSNG